jgi:four helix bundle protein
LRAADSVGANIAEASGRWHYRDRQRLLYIARGSLAETAHWIARAHARELAVPEDSDVLLDEIGRTLNGLIRQTKRA